ncbi:MAG: signal peptidase II [Clostridia bacterium]|nr:signal peptidase II [Clostridia bacterium]
MIIGSALIFIVLVAADLLTKALICPEVRAAGGTMRFIPHILRFEYTENTGMAWGLFKNGTLVLAVVSALCCVLIVFFIVKYRKRMPTLIRLALLMVLAGAFGNLVDRVFLGYVRDFLAFDFIEFPIFNFADSCVTIGAMLMGFGLVFTKKGRAFFASFDEKTTVKEQKTRESDE